MPGRQTWDGIQKFIKGIQDNLGFFFLNAIPLQFNVPGGAVAADYDGVPFIADKKYEVVVVKERHGAVGTDAGAVTLMVKKVPSGTAKAAGTDVLAAGINLKAAANTAQDGTLHATLANKQLAAGDGLGLEPTGVLTAVDAVGVTVWIKALEK